MSTCPGCGRTNEQDTAFCKGCGAALNPYEAPAAAQSAKAEPPRSRTSVLAILALVFAFLFPPLGLLLGIAASVVVGTSRGRLRGMGLAIAAMPVSFVFVLLAATAIPAFTNYMRKAKASEARLNVDMCANSIASYVATAGALPPPADWTPATPPGEEKYQPNDALWAAPPWSAIGFSMPYAHYYRYRIAAAPGAVVCQAEGDLDGDGIPSLYERSVTLSGGAAVLEPFLRETEPLE